jgi:hypothetical protein
MSTHPANPILIRREPDAGPWHAIESATGTIVPGPALQMHLWSAIDRGGPESVGTRSAGARAPRWPRRATLVA